MRLIISIIEAVCVDSECNKNKRRHGAQQQKKQHTFSYIYIYIHDDYDCYLFIDETIIDNKTFLACIYVVITSKTID